MYILDTNVVSELRKVRGGKANPDVALWFRSIGDDDAFLSVVTVHELEVGVLRTERRDPAQGAMLREWLRDYVIPAFAGRILPADMDVALVSAGFQVPDPHPFRDGLIAATALVHNMTVVTRNVADFTRTGVRVLDPWQPQSSA